MRVIDYHDGLPTRTVSDEARREALSIYEVLRKWVREHPINIVMTRSPSSSEKPRELT